MNERADSLRQPPGRRYASFLLRCWSLSDGQRRIQIEQVQSGAGTRVATLAAAFEWIDGCCGEAFDPIIPSGPTD